MRNTRIVAAALAIGAAAALTGCDSGSSSPEATASTAITEAAAPSGNAIDGDDMESTPTSNAQQRGDASTDAALSLDVVNFGHHENYDRVVFVLTGPGTPGYQVEYVEEAIQDGSGKHIDMAAKSIMQVRITGVAYPFESGAAPYDGANPLLNASSGVVTELYVGQPYEGALDSFLAVDAERPPFRVSVLSGPTRVVVDVAS
ncbi:AMIN-like domain-containing (lipo)protein [Aldersonia kunmingensis]|uniref:AMIN-like domain-containing (lipo)protein n=1 Tax=Aldersonia kunmingensis TaxID=408066 RepID=UPI0008360D27|nr:hypothetical protein [Aldersonia kunmingensis]